MEKYAFGATTFAVGIQVHENHFLQVDTIESRSMSWIKASLGTEWICWPMRPCSISRCASSNRAAAVQSHLSVDSKSQVGYRLISENARKRLRNYVLWWAWYWRLYDGVINVPRTSDITFSFVLKSSPGCEMNSAQKLDYLFFPLEPWHSGTTASVYLILPTPGILMPWEVEQKTGFRDHPHIYCKMAIQVLLLNWSGFFSGQDNS